MSKVTKSTRLYSHPFSADYWRDAAAELSDTKMLVITALMITLRIALKTAAIPLGPSLYIQTATLATALGAMIYGPVMAIPAAIISDTIGFMVWPNGDYFLPFVLTEIGSTLIYALFLYRAKVNPLRVMLARFGICLFINVVLQQIIYAWYYTWIGSPDQAKESIMGIMTLTRIFKNLALFPIESVVMTLFLGVLLPIARRAKLVYCPEADMKFTRRQIAALVALTVFGIGLAFGYLSFRYHSTSRSADYSDTERVTIQKSMQTLVLEKTDDWDGETVITIVDSAYRPLFGEQTDYTVSVYILDAEAFAAGQEADSSYSLDTLWGYSKSGPKKDPYGSLSKVATVQFQTNEETGEILNFSVTPAE